MSFGTSDALDLLNKYSDPQKKAESLLEKKAYLQVLKDIQELIGYPQRFDFVFMRYVLAKDDAPDAITRKIYQQFWNDLESYRGK